jgi:hypothetical protein
VAFCSYPNREILAFILDDHIDGVSLDALRSRFDDVLRYVCRQGYVRRQLDQPRRSLSSNPIASQCVTGFVSEPVFASGVSLLLSYSACDLMFVYQSGAYELQTRSILGTTRSGYGSDTTGRDPDLEDPDKRYVGRTYLGYSAS